MKGGTEITWSFLSQHNPVKVTIRRLPEGDPAVTRFSISLSIGGKALTAHFALASGGRLVCTFDDPGLQERE